MAATVRDGAEPLDVDMYEFTRIPILVPYGPGLANREPDRLVV